MSFISSHLLSASKALGFAYSQHTLTVKAKHIDGTPMTGQKVQIYGKFWFFNVFLGEQKTNEYGEFSMLYNWIKLPFQSEHSIIFQVYEKTMTKEKIIQESTYTLPLGEGSAVSSSVEMKVEFREYDTEFPKQKMLKAPAQLPSLWEKFLDRRLDPTPPQEARPYWKSLVPLISKPIAPNTNIDPNLEKTVADRITKEIYPSLRKLETVGGLCSYEFTGNYDLSDSTQLNTIKLFFEKTNPFRVKFMTVQAKAKPSLISRDSKDFNTYLQLINRTAIKKKLLGCQLGTHFEMGQYALAFTKYLNDHPIKRLLSPYLAGVLETNHAIEKTIPDAFAHSELTQEKVWDEIKNALSGLDFADHMDSFIQKPLLGDMSLYTQSKEIWDLIGKFVEDFFQVNSKKIHHYWYEIFNMNKALTNHSLPSKAWEGRNKIEVNSFAPMSDSLDLSKNKALTSITKGRGQPMPEEINKLSQFCQYIIYHTFWMNSVAKANETLENPENFRFSPNPEDFSAMKQKIQKQTADEALLKNNIQSPHVSPRKAPPVREMFRGVPIL